MRILVVEDDRKTAAFLRKGLSESGFVVDVACRGEDGLHLAMGNDYSFIVLDVMLPGRDGWSIVSALRRSGRQVPVLFLTARDTVAERIKGFNLGADDYIVKPFSFAELVARIRSVLRRSSVRQPESLTCGDLTISPLNHRASRQGVLLDLTPKEFSLLTLLASHVGEVLSRTYIAEQIWDMNFDCETNVIDVHIRRLRSKVDDPFGPKLIQTVRGVGYVLDEPR